MPFRLAAGSHAVAHHARKSALLTLFMAGVALWQSCSFAFRTAAAGTGFVAAGSSPPQLAANGRRGGVALRAGYAFELKQSAEHKELVIDPQEEGGVRVSTHNKELMTGGWNTVLGDTELPAKGRSYWEVKIVKKPTDAWEYIGVAEPSADVTVPLTRNRKGAGWFWGSTWSDSFVYTFLEMRPEFNEAYQVRAKELVQRTAKWDKLINEKERLAQATEQVKTWMTGPGTHIGMDAGMTFPKFKDGMVVGVDVDMDAGSVGFWADGKFLGNLRDSSGKLVNLQGKKVVPALSVYGRTTGGQTQYTVMEVKSGLEPPTRP